MILFFGNASESVFVVETTQDLSSETLQKLTWLFADAKQIEEDEIISTFIGPRAAMVTPWSTNAVEICQNMGIEGINRIELFQSGDMGFDPMIYQKYVRLHQEIFAIYAEPESIKVITDIAQYNEQEGLALNDEEIDYLNGVAEKIGRPLTDSEVFGFSQVNSEHCRHKIFNGSFVIDGEEKEASLFSLIKKTSKAAPDNIVSAYKDNVAFIKGPNVMQFAPKSGDKPDYYEEQEFDSVISLKAETHNFPTTVEPFSGAATGSGGEIRDRLAGGKGSIPLAGTAVYMTSYSRLNENRPWEKGMEEREWLYQRPIDILIKASNGASDFGNKFGQPLIAGSVLTFEHEEEARKLGFDKVIMLAGGIGYGKRSMAQKDVPKPGDKIVILGGDNYRIGMGGAAVSSGDTGAFGSGIELNAVQRSNPEMQKRTANAIRALVESSENPIISIHDHGAGGHLNCLSELVEEVGGLIHIEKLPIGDPTLSAKEIIGNESQERMGLIVAEKDLDLIKRIAERERAPMYVVGEVTGDHRFSFVSDKDQSRPMDLAIEDMFGSSPKTILTDHKVSRNYSQPEYQQNSLSKYLADVLRLEAVACKDWLTNKVDRCVGGRVAKQQCVGPLQLPLNNVGVMALDYKSKHGIATAIGHAPIAGLIDAQAGAKNAIAESLTNLIWAPVKGGLKSVSLSANWMWPAKNEGEDERLYSAVQAVSDMAIALSVNVPTGKDSLSMKQKYPNEDVLSPGTVIITAGAHCDDINAIIEPVFKRAGGPIVYFNFSGMSHELGGSSFAQSMNKIGAACPSIDNYDRFANSFDLIQAYIREGKIVAGHDVAAGGLITTLLEMCFADINLGAKIDLSELGEVDSIKLLFSENASVVMQLSTDEVYDEMLASGLELVKIGAVVSKAKLEIKNHDLNEIIDVTKYRDVWYETSYLLDQNQTANKLAKARFDNYKNQGLQFKFPSHFTGALPKINKDQARPKAAILREKGSNSERELANALYLAGFDVKDIHMTDLISGRETLEDIRFLGAVGGFSNSDVLGSAKGWAGAFLYNEKAKACLDRFFERQDVLSIGICNGCQLFIELNLINPDHQQASKMTFNDSHKHESAFTSVNVEETNSIMLQSLEGSNLGVWISHGEGKFVLPQDRADYNIAATYSHDAYPSNPNGSDYNAAMVVSKDGRHLVTMPHIERSTFQWNWANYPEGRKDDVSPWLEAFVNARKWIETN